MFLNYNDKYMFIFFYKNQNLENFIKTLIPNSPNILKQRPAEVNEHSKHNKQTN